VAGQAEFSKHGYARTTTTSIAARTGVSVGTLYQYFKDKDAILRELAGSRFDAIAAAVVATLATPDPVGGTSRETALKSLQSVVRAVADYHREDPGLHAVLTERRYADPVLDDLTTHSEHQMVARVEQLLIAWGHQGDTAALAFVLFGMVEGTIHAHVLGESMVDDDRFFAALVDAMARLALPDSKP